MEVYHRFQLAKRGKTICPICRRNTFVQYIDTATGQPIADNVGKCDRADKCAHHYTPKQYFTDNQIKPEYAPNVAKMKTNISQLFIQPSLMRNTLNTYQSNNFVAYLKRLFPDEVVKDLIEKYYIGTFTPFNSAMWKDCVVFWQIDIDGRVRYGKIMQYRSTTGHRLKDGQGNPIITSFAKVMKMNTEGQRQCFFGEHLLRNSNNTVAVVESEKTAIVASAYFPQYTWIATGGSNGLNESKCKVLQGRKVIIFPDNSQYDNWLKKSKMLNNAVVSDFLENDSIKKGADLADLLEANQYEHQTISRCPQVSQSVASVSQWNTKTVRQRDNEHFRFDDVVTFREDWTAEIESLKDFFDNYEDMPKSIRLSSISNITDVPLFISYHLPIVTANNGIYTFRPYLDRLIDLRSVLQSQHQNTITNSIQ